MKVLLKMTGLVIAVIMLMTIVIAGCGTKGNGTTQTTGVAHEGPDISQKVKLIGYDIGDPQLDHDLVFAELNKKLETDLNATVTLNFVSWGDFTTKYPLLLAAGDSIDFIFDTYWVDFSDQMRKGAFMPLDELLLLYAPKMYNETPESSWQQAKYTDGKIYMIPMDKSDIGMPGIGYREDLRNKYSVPEFKKIADLELYFDAILQNEQEMKGMDGIILGVGNPLTNIYYNFMMEHGYYLDNSPFPCGITYKMEDENPVLINTFDLPEVKEFCKMTQQWFNKGYWSTQNLVDKTFAASNFFNGTSSVMGADGTLVYIYLQRTAETKPDWDYGYFYSTTPQGHVPPKQAVDYALCIPASSENPERTIMFLEMLFYDQDYADLFSYGIKDMHYIEKDDGSVDFPDGVTGDNTTYYPMSSQFSYLVRQEVKRPNPARIQYAKGIDEQLQSQLFFPKLLVCPIDQNNINNEVAAVNGIIEQYFNGMLLPGLSKDVDADYAAFLDKLKKAGIDKVLDAVNMQSEEFLKD